MSVVARISNGTAAILLTAVVAFPTACAASPTPERTAAISKGRAESMTSREATRERPWLGVNAQELPHVTHEQAVAHVAAMRRAGMQFVRMDAPWAFAEYTRPGLDGRHHYDWSWLDRFAYLFAANQLEWLPILDAPPGWAMRNEGHPWAPPANDRYFADFAGAFARRYGAGGTFWREHPELRSRPVRRYEIWNEPDQKWFWWPQPDPAHFARLYLAARGAIKAVDPNGETITGGMSASRETLAYVEQMFRSSPGLERQIDGFGWHPYAPTLAYSFYVTREMRSLLDRLGAATVPLDITEMGWSTAPGVSREHDLVADEATRARDLPRALTTYSRSNCGVRTFAAHTWVTSQERPDDIEDWFGLYNPDATPNRSGAAYARAVRKTIARMSSARKRPRIAICDR